MSKSGEIDGTASVHRRDLFRGTMVLPFAVSRLMRPDLAPGAEAEEIRRDELTIRQRNPDNLEFPFSELDTRRLVTPSDRFYVRTHFEEPRLDSKQWRLKVEGAVERPFELGYAELRGMPSKSRTVLLECSGNGRIFLPPPQLGVRWELGGVGTAEWTGVPLSDLLERAGVKPDAVEVVLEGADRGEYREPLPRTPGKISYARSLPLAKATAPEVLLAYAMNGEDLPLSHGFPVRAIVAGWYGMASVKWLARIVVTERPFDGYFQTFMYATWARRQGLATLAPVTEIQVKAQIARPAPYERLPRASKYRMYGAAWAGEEDVSRVEVSDDGGKSWTLATLLDRPVRHAWRFWELDWKTPSTPGRHVLMARAMDTRGRVQAMERDPDRRDAVINLVLPIEVEVA